MKIDRLMGILTILLQREKVTAPELAKRFEVSRRTISRDLDDLCRAGLPIAATQGYGGGISLAPGYTIGKNVFTRAELQAVLAGLKGMESVSAAPCAAAVMEKLSLPENAAEDIVLIDLASHYRTALTEKIEALRRAILARRTVTFQYYYEKGEAQRRVEPYRLVFRWASWYVLCYCLERQDFRLFKLNRLWDVRETGAQFEPRAVPPQALAADRWLQEPQYRLQAEFDPGEKYRLIDEYGVDCYTVLPDGRLRLERDFSSYNTMREWVFSFGARVRVLAPARLRRDRLAQAEQILQQQAET